MQKTLLTINGITGSNFNYKDRVLFVDDCYYYLGNYTWNFTKGREPLRMDKYKQTKLFKYFETY